MGKILRPGEEFLPPQIPMISVRDEEGETQQVVAAAAVLISPQVQQAIYQATKAACLDALKDFHAALGRITAAALDPQLGGPPGEVDPETESPEEGAA